MAGLSWGRKRACEAGKELFSWSYPLTLFTVVAILVVAYLCQYAQIVACQYSLVQMKAQKRKLLAKRAELELKVQELTSLERVEQVAVKRLGMIAPSKRLVLEIPSGRAIGYHNLSLRSERVR